MLHMMAASYERLVRELGLKDENNNMRLLKGLHLFWTIGVICFFVELAFPVLGMSLRTSRTSLIGRSSIL